MAGLPRVLRRVEAMSESGGEDLRLELLGARELGLLAGVPVLPQKVKAKKEVDENALPHRDHYENVDRENGYVLRTLHDFSLYAEGTMAPCLDMP